MRIFIDTSVLVAASLLEHQDHVRAHDLISEVHKGKYDAFFSAHSALETFATLTRMPAPFRISPDEASAMIRENFLSVCKCVALNARAYEQLIAELAKNQVSGGKCYDALILACAKASKAERIYTFNLKHFRTLAPEIEDKIQRP